MSPWPPSAPAQDEPKDAAAQPDKDGFVSLFDGKTLDGWKVGDKADPGRWRTARSSVHSGPSHLFYVGPVHDHDWKNFHLKAEVMTHPARQFRHLFPHHLSGKGLARRRLRGPGQLHARRLEKDRQPVRRGGYQGSAPQGQQVVPLRHHRQGRPRHAEDRRQRSSIGPSPKVSSRRRATPAASSTTARSPCRATTRGARPTSKTSASSRSTTEHGTGLLAASAHFSSDNLPPANSAKSLSRTKTENRWGLAGVAKSAEQNPPRRTLPRAGEPRGAATRSAPKTPRRG